LWCSRSAAGSGAERRKEGGSVARSGAPLHAPARGAAPDPWRGGGSRRSRKRSVGAWSGSEIGRAGGRDGIRSESKIISLLSGRLSGRQKSCCASGRYYGPEWRPGTIDMSCWARAVLFRVVPSAVNRTRPIWNSIASSALLRRPPAYNASINPTLYFDC
jgi:hypothetical protein